MDISSPQKVYFVGAGPGDPELLTLKGARLLGQADTVIYAGSLVNPRLLELCQPEADLVDSAPLCLEDLVRLMAGRSRAGQRVVRLHSGDPALFGAIKEQIAGLKQAGAQCEVVPGVSSLAASAAALSSELTVPGVSQTVIITRAAGRTPVPEGEALSGLASHGATMAIFLSAALVEKVEQELLDAYPPQTPVAVVQRASWPDQRILQTTVQGLAAAVKAAGIDRTAMILVGQALAQQGEESLLYDKSFSHGYRQAEADEGKK